MSYKVYVFIDQFLLSCRSFGNEKPRNGQQSNMKIWYNIIFVVEKERDLTILLLLVRSFFLNKMILFSGNVRLNTFLSIIVGFGV